MYYKQISPIGCLLWTILLVWLFFKLKLYYVIIFVVILAFAYNLFIRMKAGIKAHKIEQERNFEPELNEVYKACPFCGKDVKRNATVCPHCNHPID